MADEAEYRKLLRQNTLILPKQPYHDDYLQTMTKLFHWSCWFGVVGTNRIFWKLWSLSVFIILIVIECAAIWKVIKALAGWAVDIIGHRSVTARLAGTIFYSIAIISLILCSRFHSSWEGITTLWISTERSTAINISPDVSLKRRMIIVTIITAFCSFLEHITSMVSLIGFDCPPSLILRRYTLLSHGFIILRHEYSNFYPIPFLIMSTIATILWNFQDLLIVLVSMGLTSRYRRLNECVAKMCALEKKDQKYDKKKKAIKVYTWRKIREAYVKQATLVRNVDDSIGAMIVVSSFCNFYFICLQLFLGITQGSSSTLLRKIYFVTSFIWLCTRVISVVLTAADVNVHSKRALKYIYDCDALYYNVEMERLQDQLTKDYVALSGMGFFYLTRTLLLQMAAAVVTYELVLIQFDK